VTGYGRRFDIGEAPGLLLATRLDAATLEIGNGFPVRLVAPRRRGFEWVKWVVSIETDMAPGWWQPPFPLQ
jgi:DMSO/TMAO reductase YedYZ molybdopterin-dependent catalytic subunit